MLYQFIVSGSQPITSSVSSQINSIVECLDTTNSVSIQKTDGDQLQYIGIYFIVPISGITSS